MPYLIYLAVFALGFWLGMILMASMAMAGRANQQEEAEAAVSYQVRLVKMSPGYWALNCPQPLTSPATRRPAITVGLFGIAPFYRNLGYRSMALCNEGD